MQTVHNSGRRDFLRFAAAAGLLTQLPSAFATADTNDTWMTSFNDALAAEP